MLFKAMSRLLSAGMLSSMDDFYILDSRMVVTETSNDVYDISLLELSTNQAGLSWHRVRIANMMADDGPSWAALIGTHNSGTYTNQYMVVDLKKFEPYSELQAGLLTIAEVMPGEERGMGTRPLPSPRIPAT